MERSRASDERLDQFRGPSGYESVGEMDPAERSTSMMRLGLVCGALLLCTVVFVAVPSPSDGAGANTHGLAMRCVDNSACAAANLVGDCCPAATGKKLACCRDPTNIATVTKTAKGACAKPRRTDGSPRV